MALTPLQKDLAGLLHFWIIHAIYGMEPYLEAASVDLDEAWKWDPLHHVVYVSEDDYEFCNKLLDRVSRRVMQEQRVLTRSMLEELRPGPLQRLVDDVRSTL